MSVELLAMLGPYMIGALGFGFGYLTKRMHGESRQQALLDEIAGYFRGGPQADPSAPQQPADPTSPVVPPAPVIDPAVVASLLDLAHKLMDKLNTPTVKP